MTIGEFVYKLGNKEVVAWSMTRCYLIIPAEESRIHDYILTNVISIKQHSPIWPTTIWFCCAYYDYNACVGQLLDALHTNQHCTRYLWLIAVNLFFSYDIDKLQLRV